MKGHKKGFNDYKIIGNITIIFLYKRSGEKFEALIDTEDLEKVKNLGYHWGVQWDNHIKTYYVKTSEYLGYIEGKPKYLTHYLHHIIKPIEKGEFCDHDNHNALDNRKENLITTTNKNNVRKRRGVNPNNTSGYRNVSWSSKENKWLVQLQVDNKNTRLKDFPFEQLDEAGIYAEKMRKKYYGEFAGNS